LNSTSADWNDYFIQTADIDATLTTGWDSGSGFSPIGNTTTHFTGSYNGQDHVIEDLFINRPSTDYVGLFGRITGAEVENIGVINVDITGHNECGGLVGHSNSSSVITYCYSTGSVNGDTDVGGLVGQSFDSSLSNSYSSVSVTAIERVGGLLGRNYSTALNNSYATGSVNGDDQVGGLVGNNSNFATIKYCFSTGLVSGNTSWVGGLAGYNSINNNYSSILYTFWDTQISGMTTGIGGGTTNTGLAGKTSLEMKTQSTFTNANWDFATTWSMDGNNNSGYPYLDWQTFADYPAGEITDLASGSTINPSLDLNDAADQTIPPVPNVGFLAGYENVFSGTGIVDISIETSFLHGAYYHSGSWHSEPNSGGQIVFTGIDFDAKGDVPVILGDDDPLPVSLSSFTAIQTQGNFAQISWTTQSESNISGYNLYRNTELNNDTALKVNPDLIQGTNTADEQNYSYLDETVEIAEYYYWLESVELSGITELYGPISISIQHQPDNQTPPTTVITGLYQNYPNPFNPETEIQFALDEPGKAELAVYNIKGQEVIRLYSDRAEAGVYITVKWNGKDHSGNDVASGVYMYKLKTDSKEYMKKMILMK